MKIVYLIFARHKNYTIFSELSQHIFAIFSEFTKFSGGELLYTNELRKYAKKRRYQLARLKKN